MAALQPPDQAPVTPVEFAPFESKLELVCKACGQQGKYRVGRIFIDPERALKPHKSGGLTGDEVAFSGYFHCRHCGAGGPWEPTGATFALLLALLVEAQMAPERARIHFAQFQMFDGTVVHTSTEAEAYLQKRIAADPDNDFLWDRLGNLYDTAEEAERAFAAYEQAVALNPRNVEAQYSLGYYLMDKKGQPGPAAEHLKQVLRHCRAATGCPRQLLHDMVRDALERLFELHPPTRGGVNFLPPIDPAETVAGDESSGLPVRLDLDLATEEGWETLTTAYLTGRISETRAARPSPPGRLPRTAQPASGPSVRVGRNDPCPCGSGKKFKHCCLRTQ